ncbi:MAG: arsenate reductase family protein [Spirochaetales bacterium]|nr:arsenate reductase family protein [Spirochaetales bacterium]
MTIICYPRCGTCRKAEAFLKEHDIPYTYRDIKEANPTKEELASLYERSGLPLRRFFNTSGRLYREHNLKDRLPMMSDDEALELLSTDGMLVKRPILVTGARVFVGFKEAEWKDLIG